MFEQQSRSKNKSSLFFSQIKAIILTNLLANLRCWLLWKQLAMIAFIICAAILQIQTQKGLQPPINAKIVLFFYNTLAIIFIARAEVMVHMDNRNKFLYFQKAYGLNSVIYTLTWVFYSLLVGAIKFFIYIFIIYLYLSNNDDFFQQFFIGYGFPGQNFFITYYQNCYVTFLAYLSTYSYCLLLAVLLKHNQIGLKVLTPLIAITLICYLQAGYFYIIDMDKMTYISPLGWLTCIGYYRQAPPTSFLAKEKYIELFLYQFFVPFVSAIIIECLMINIFYIGKSIQIKAKKIKQRIMANLKTGLINRQSQLQETSSLKLLIKIENLSKKGKERPILKDVNLQILKGQTIVLFGKNGSGKSTLLNILANVNNYQKGSITSTKKIQFGISMEDNFFMNELTIKENLNFYARLKGVDIDSSNNQYLQRFQLIDFGNKSYFKISGGSRKKLSIACAFLGENDVILLDQPTMGIDYQVTKQIQKIIKREKAHNKDLTLILSTCNLQFSFINFMDRLWVLQKGIVTVNSRIEDIENMPIYIIGSFQNIQDSERLQQCLKALRRVDPLSIKIKDKKTFLYFNENSLNDVLWIITEYKLKDVFEFSTPRLIQKIQTRLYDQLKGQKITNTKQIQDLTQLWSELQPRQSFLNLLLSSFLIRCEECMPSLLDTIYFLSMPVFCWFIFHWMTKENIPYNANAGLFQYSYPLICNFLYTHIIVTQLKFKQTYYENMIFKMGMKKIPYWIATYIMNIFIINIPFLIVMAVSRPENIDLRISDVSFYSFAFVSITYFFSLFFTSSYFSFSAISIIMTIISTYSQSVLDYYIQVQYQYGIDHIKQLKIFFKIFVPSYEYNSFSQEKYWVLIFLGQAFMYIFFYFVITEIIYRIRNIRSSLKSHELMGVTYEDAINEKLRIFDVVQNRAQNPNASIIFSDVYLRYSKKLVGIKGLNFMVEKGSVFGLLGMNGSGKSTTVKLAINQIFKTAGYVYFGHKQIKAETSDIYEQSSISPQYNYLIEDMRVSLHLRIMCALKGIKFSQQNKVIECLVKAFDMQEMLSTKIINLSGGNKRKLKLISALIGKPKYLLMDEPTLGIDKQSQRIFGSILLFFTQRFHTSCIYVTHKLDQVERYCGKIGIIKRGGLVLSGKTKDLIERYSQGVNISLYSKDIKKLSTIVNQIFNDKKRVFQLTLLQERNEIKLMMPFQQFDFGECFKVIMDLKKDGLIQGYGLKRQRLCQVFSYLISQTDTTLSLISTNNQTVQ